MGITCVKLGDIEQAAELIKNSPSPVVQLTWILSMCAPTWLEAMMHSENIGPFHGWEKVMSSEVRVTPIDFG